MQAEEKAVEIKHAPLPIPVVKPPTDEERQKHVLTHWPYASWCEACVAARSRLPGHSTGQAIEDRPNQGCAIAAMDFWYNPTRDKEHSFTEEEIADFATTLTCMDLDSKSKSSLSLAHKGSEQLTYVTTELVRFMVECKLDEVSLQSDNEAAILQVKKAVREARRRLGLKTTFRESGVEDHQANGAIERAIQTERRTALCLKATVKSNYGATLTSQDGLWCWAVRHSSWLTNRFNTNSTTKKTSYETLNDCPYKGRLACFAETVQFPIASQKKGDLQWDKGLWLGKTHSGDMHIVSDAQGIHEVNHVKRCENQWQLPVLQAAQGLPWAYQDGAIKRQLCSFRCTPLWHCPQFPKLQLPKALCPRQD